LSIGLRLQNLQVYILDSLWRVPLFTQVTHGGSQSG